MAGMSTVSAPAPITGKRGVVHRRWNKLWDETSSWRSHWMELTDYLLPRRGRYTIESQNTKGRKRSNKIYDGSPSQALRTMSAGMMSGLTNPARPWFRFKLEPEELMERPGVKKWLGQSEVAVRTLLARSNFYNAMSVVYTELGAFGTAVLYKMPHPTRQLHYRPLTVGEYALAEDQFNDVNTLARKFTMTVDQVVRRFVMTKSPDPNDWEWGKVSTTVKDLWRRQAYDQPIEICHLIQPRPLFSRDLNRMDGPNRPIMDVYIEAGDNIGMNKVLQESGFTKQPFYAVRWELVSGDVYGTSPGMVALGDIKQLQTQTKRKAQAIDKHVNPPMVGTNNLKGQPTSVLPGTVTYVDPAQGTSGFQPAYQVNPDLQYMIMDIQEVQQRIQREFYADLFAMMINSDRRQMTATEVAERHEEKLILLGPVLQRLNVELLDHVVEDAFEAALASGMIPEPPDEIAGQDMQIKYVSLLAQAQEAAAAAALERTLGLAGNMAAVLPDVLDNIDGDAALREYSQILGNSPNILRSREDVEQMRQARAEAVQRQQMAEQAKVEAEAAKTLSETDTTSPNALTQILSGVGGAASVDAGAV